MHLAHSEMHLRRSAHLRKGIPLHGSRIKIDTRRTIDLLRQSRVGRQNFLIIMYFHGGKARGKKKGEKERERERDGGPVVRAESATARRRRCAHGIFPGTAADKSQARKNIPVDAWAVYGVKESRFPSAAVRRSGLQPATATTGAGGNVGSERRTERGSETGGD